MMRKGPGLSQSHMVPMKPPDLGRKSKQPAFTTANNQETHVHPSQDFVTHDYEAENAKNCSKIKFIKDALPMKKKNTLRNKTSAVHNHMTPTNVSKIASRSRRDGENINVNKSESSANFSDVWSVIRNMNRTQFKNSPLLSEEDLTKKKMIKKRRYVNNRRDKQLTGCCTEEFAFISTITDVEGGFSPSHRPIDNKIKIIDPTELDYRYNVDTCRSNLDSVREKRNDIKRPTIKFVTNVNNNLRKINNCLEQEKNTRVNNIAKKCEPRGLTNQKRAHRVQMVDKDVTYFESYQENSTVLYNNNTFNSPSIQTVSAIANKDVENDNLQFKNFGNVPNEEFKKSIYTKNNLPRKIHPLRPNLTQTEINRRLSKMRFPMIILGKDEVNNKGKFLINDYSQFYGLDQHVWPYMKLWMGTNTTSNSYCSTVMKCESYIDNTSHICEPMEVEMNSDKLSTKKSSSKNCKLNKKCKRSRQTVREKSKLVHKKTSSTSNKRVLRNKKSNASSLVKDTRLNKKTEHKVALKYVLPHHIDNIRRSIEVTSREKNKNKSKIPLRANEHKGSRPYPSLPNQTAMGHRTTDLLEKHQLQDAQKQRHASSVIDDVMRNVQNGSYYIVDDNQKTHAELNAIATQTCTEEQDKEEKLKRISNVIKAITANDVNLKELKINSLNENQIEVHNGVQKISIVFDIIILAKINNMSHGSSNSLNYTPLVMEDTEMHKFKYEHSIINEMLPAELCTIVPKLFSDMQKPFNGLQMPIRLPRVKISDLNIAKLEAALLPVQNLRGNFTKKQSIWPNRILPKNKIEEFSHSHKVLTPLTTKKVITFFVNLHFPLINQLINFDYMEDFKPSRPINSFEFKDKQVDCQCTQLQIYDQFNHKRTMENILRYLFNACISASTQVKMNTLSPPVPEQLRDDQIILSIGVVSSQTNENISVAFDRRNEFAGTKSMIKLRDESIVKSKSLTIVTNSYSFDCTKTETTNPITLKKPVLKKRHYIKLYRKCKSAANVAREKSVTKIDKIRNADDFYEALGPGNLLSNVVDSTMATMIIDSLKEMRTWISEISPRQALLVMLLLNKKVTPYLARCRPLILQAIAVNRITMSNELDMEIEVIEKEKLVPVTQKKELIRKDSSEGRDTLLEEMYFIAKTTASDYQRPFDETSEKLLKSLLQKRKKLNPSYLRVMARYVGLGLLKPPKK